MLLNHFRKAAFAAPTWKGEFRAWLYAVLAIACLLCAGFAFANQTPSSTAGTGPVTKTFPGGTTMQVSLSGANSVIFDDSIPLNGLGGVPPYRIQPIPSKSMSVLQDVQLRFYAAQIVAL